MKDIKLLFVLLFLLGIIILLQKSPLQKKHANFLFQKKMVTLPVKNIVQHRNIVKPTQHMVNLQQLFYPGASQISKTANTLVLLSSDDPALITDWYKTKFQKNFSGKTFVQTKINGDIHNKLIGEGNKFGVSIEVNKNLDQTLSTITVTISSS